MSDVVCWDTDGTTFRIYSNGVLVLETPLNAASGTPTEVVVIDPSTGLPATFAIGSSSIGLPAGHIGDLLWHDGSGWVILAASGADSYVLTQSASGGDLIPSWQAPHTGQPTLPPPVTPTPEYQCNIARFVGGQLLDAYNLMSAWMVNQSRAEVASFLVGAGSLPADFVKVLVEAFGGPLVWGATLVSALLAILINANTAGQLLPISPSGEEDVYRTLYCALRHQGPTQLLVDGTTLFDWSINLEAPGLDFIGLQDGVLRQCIVTIPVQQWTDWSAQAQTSANTLCVGYDCAGLTYG